MKEILKAVVLIGQLGFVVILVILITFGLGYYLDKLLGTDPYLKILFLLIGVGAGYWSAARLLKSFLKDQ